MKFWPFFKKPSRNIYVKPKAKWAPAPFVRWFNVPGIGAKVRGGRRVHAPRLRWFDPEQKCFELCWKRVLSLFLAIPGDFGGNMCEFWVRVRGHRREKLFNSRPVGGWKFFRISLPPTIIIVTVKFDYPLLGRWSLPHGCSEGARDGCALGFLIKIDD